MLARIESVRRRGILAAELLLVAIVVHHAVALLTRADTRCGCLQAVGDPSRPTILAAAIVLLSILTLIRPARIAGRGGSRRGAWLVLVAFAIGAGTALVDRSSGDAIQLDADKPMPRLADPSSPSTSTLAAPTTAAPMRPPQPPGAGPSSASDGPTWHVWARSHDAITTMPNFMACGDLATAYAVVGQTTVLRSDDGLRIDVDSATRPTLLVETTLGAVLRRFEIEWESPPSYNGRIEWRVRETGRTIRGRVIDGFGVPIAAVPITVSGLDDGRSVTTDGTPERLAAAEIGQTARVICDANGEFRVEGWGRHAPVAFYSGVRFRALTGTAYAEAIERASRSAPEHDLTLVLGRVLVAAVRSSRSGSIAAKNFGFARLRWLDRVAPGDPGSPSSIFDPTAPRGAVPPADGTRFAAMATLRSAEPNQSIGHPAGRFEVSYFGVVPKIVELKWSSADDPKPEPVDLGPEFEQAIERPRFFVESSAASELRSCVVVLAGRAAGSMDDSRLAARIADNGKEAELLQPLPPGRYEFRLIELEDVRLELQVPQEGRVPRVEFPRLSTLVVDVEAPPGVAPTDIGVVLDAETDKIPRLEAGARWDRGVELALVGLDGLRSVYAVRSSRIPDRPVRVTVGGAGLDVDSTSVRLQRDTVVKVRLQPKIRVEDRSGR